MLRTSLAVISGVALTISLLTFNFVHGQQKVEIRAAETPSSPGQALRAKEILGGKVMIQGNVSIGVVDDFVVDQDGYIEYLIVSNDGKLVTVPWDAAKFNFQQRSAFVEITQDQFRKIPVYTAEKYPVYTAPNYRTEIYRYYNVTPRERRLERRLDRRQ